MGRKIGGCLLCLLKSLVLEMNKPLTKTGYNAFCGYSAPRCQLAKKRNQPCVIACSKYWLWCNAHGEVRCRLTALVQQRWPRGAAIGTGARGRSRSAWLHPEDHISPTHDSRILDIARRSGQLASASRAIISHMWGSLHIT